MKVNKWKLLIGQGQYCDRNKKVPSDDIERTSPKQRALEGSKKWLPSSILEQREQWSGNPYNMNGEQRFWN